MKSIHAPTDRNSRHYNDNPHTHDVLSNCIALNSRSHLNQNNDSVMTLITLSDLCIPLWGSRSENLWDFALAWMMARA